LRRAISKADAVEILFYDAVSLTEGSKEGLCDGEKFYKGAQGIISGYPARNAVAFFVDGETHTFTVRAIVDAAKPRSSICACCRLAPPLETFGPPSYRSPPATTLTPTPRVPLTSPRLSSTSETRRQEPRA